MRFSTRSSLVTTYQYDFNQNLIKTTKPEGNTVEYDYDERDKMIATRVGNDPSEGINGAVTVQAFDGSGNLIDTVGPAQRGTAAQSLSVIIDDAFNGSVAKTYTGDWVVQNTYDGFDRLIKSVDAVGGVTQNTYDPLGNLIATQRSGTAGGPTPTDRTGSYNVLLSSGGQSAIRDTAKRLPEHGDHWFRRQSNAHRALRASHHSHRRRSCG